MKCPAAQTPLLQNADLTSLAAHSPTNLQTRAPRRAHIVGGDSFRGAQPPGIGHAGTEALRFALSIFIASFISLLLFSAVRPVFAQTKKTLPQIHAASARVEVLSRTSEPAQTKGATQKSALGLLSKVRSVGSLLKSVPAYNHHFLSQEAP